MKKNLCFLVLSVTLQCLGCSRVIKESYYGATGATGRF